MSLCVDHPAVQIDLVSIGKEEIQILESLSQKKRLHHVLRPQVKWVFNVANTCVAMLDLGVLLDTLVMKTVYRSL